MFIFIFYFSQEEEENYMYIYIYILNMDNRIYIINCYSPLTHSYYAHYLCDDSYRKITILVQYFS